MFGHARLDDLEGHPAVHGFDLLGHVDHAKTAFSDLLQQFVTPDHHAGALNL